MSTTEDVSSDDDDIVYLCTVSQLDRAIISIVSESQTTNPEISCTKNKRKYKIPKTSICLEETETATNILEKILDGSYEEPLESEMEHDCSEQLSDSNGQREYTDIDADIDCPLSPEIQKKESKKLTNAVKTTDSTTISKKDVPSTKPKIPRAPVRNQRIFKFYPPPPPKVEYVTDMKYKLKDNLGTDLSFLTPEFLEDALKLKASNVFSETVTPEIGESSVITFDDQNTSSNDDGQVCLHYEASSPFSDQVDTCQEIENFVPETDWQKELLAELATVPPVYPTDETFLELEDPAAFLASIESKEPSVGIETETSKSGDDKKLDENKIDLPEKLSSSHETTTSACQPPRKKCLVDFSKIVDLNATLGKFALSSKRQTTNLSSDKRKIK